MVRYSSLTIIHKTHISYFHIITIANLTFKQIIYNFAVLPQLYRNNIVYLNRIHD